jgi:hypothetical protein
LSQFHPFVFVWEQFVVVEFFILLDMGGGASHAFHHLIGEHSLNEDQQQHYHNEYKALEATGMEEPQIIDELRNRLKNKMGSNNSMDGGSSRSTRIKANLRPHLRRQRLQRQTQAALDLDVGAETVSQLLHRDPLAERPLLSLEATAKRVLVPENRWMTASPVESQPQSLRRKLAILGRR